MIISSITIKNLKSIPSLWIPFDQKSDITLVLGANGIGKTTALQALSLLGHLPTMSLLRQDSGVWRLFRPTHNGQAVDYVPALNVEEEAYEVARVMRGKVTAKQWFLDSDGTSLGGICKFTLNHPSAGKKSALYVYIRDDAPPISDVIENSQLERMSISRMLSDAALVDEDFWRYCTIIVDDVHHDSLIEIVDAQYQCRPRKNAALRSGYLSGSMLSPAIHYVNTDLNDFGRGFDLRESPKDLYKDFDEFSRRFGIEREGSGAEQTILKLNKALAAVVAYPKSLQGESTLGKTALSIISLMPRTVRKNSTDTSPIIVQRYDDTSVSTDFLSSGENEVFFLFLLLLTIPEKSIVILDEPDIHISSFQKRVLFREIFSLAKRRKLRLVVSTHSDVALTVKSTKGTVSFNREAKVIRYGRTLKSSMESDFKGNFLFESAMEHWSVAFASVMQVFKPFVYKNFLQSALSQVERNTPSVAMFLVVLGSFITLLVSFGVDFVVRDSPGHWQIWLKLLGYIFGSGTIGFVIMYGYARAQRKYFLHRTRQDDEEI